MFFYKKKKGKKKNKGSCEKLPKALRKVGISYAQMCAISDKILSKRRLIIYTESE